MRYAEVSELADEQCFADTISVSVGASFLYCGKLLIVYS